MSRRFAVACGDFAHYMDPAEEWTVGGFADLATAQDYARRFVRASVEACRAPGMSPEAPGMSPEQVLEAWSRFGEYAAIEGFDSRDWARHCAATPAVRPEDTDYAALDPRQRASG